MFKGQPFTRKLAERHGVLRSELSRAIVAGAIAQPFRGIFIATESLVSPQSRAACLALVLPSGAAVSRRTAAWLWGVDVREPGQQSQPVPIECTVPVGREPLRRPNVHCFVAPMTDADVVDVNGIPCTSALRTAVDLLRWLRPHMALGSADAMAHTGLVTVEDLITAVELWAGRPGVAQARRLAGLVEPLTESFGESWLRLRIIDAGFPRPEPQIKILDRSGRLVYRLDLGWEDVRKAVEYDGQEFHSGPDAKQKDDGRIGRLKREFHWDVVPVGRGEVLGRSLALERGVGELLGLEPQILVRTW